MHHLQGNESFFSRSISRESSSNFTPQKSRRETTVVRLQQRLFTLTIKTREDVCFSLPQGFPSAAWRRTNFDFAADPAPEEFLQFACKLETPFGAFCCRQEMQTRLGRAFFVRLSTKCFLIRSIFCLDSYPHQ
jgi:hypothetical protein